MSFYKIIILSQVLRPTAILELPTAQIPKDPIFWQIGTSSSFSLASKYDPHVTDFDLNGFVSFNGKWFLGLNVFTLNEISLDLGTVLISEADKYPVGISLGIRNISWKKYISSVGGDPKEGGGFTDDNSYILRSPEIFSIYGVLTKHINQSLIIHLGIGRGEFIGYGPRSKFLNTDKFLKTPHEYFTFGIFGTTQFYLTPNLHLALEADGRDINLGFLIDLDKFKFVAQAQKIEHFLFRGYPNFHPRVNFGIAVTSRITVPEVQPVPVKFEIIDKETKKALKGAVIRVLQTEIPSILTDDKGIASLNLMPGNYLVSITHPQYKGLRVKLNIKKEKPLTAKIRLSPKISKSELAAQKIKEGDALFKIEKLLEAKKAYEEALSIYPESKTAKERLTSVKLAIKNKTFELKSKAQHFEARGDYKSAISYYKEALTYSPDDQEVKNKIEELQKKIEEPQPKKEVVKKVEPPRPTKEQLENTLNKAIQHFKAGNYKEAKKLLQEVLKWDPSNPQAQDYLRRTEARLKVLGEE